MTEDRTPSTPAPATGTAAVVDEVRREQQHVDRVVARVDQLRDEARHREAASLRSPRGGTPQAVYERDVVAHFASSRRAHLDTADDGLVFGRLDRLDGEVLHLGRLGVRDEDSEPLVVDWRAPAAAAFYRATAAQPMGVVRRRTITCRSTVVRGVDDELLDPERADELEGSTVVGDGAFLAALSRERTGHMRDIVATIQGEQDEAVRAPDDGAIVITGGPGTGKTAVALHRVAYLMYARRDFYARRGVLVVGPSPVFVDYIGQVLPALGEDSVRLASLGGLPYLPRGLTVQGHDAPLAASVKGSLRMATLLERVVSGGTDAGVPDDLEMVRWGITVRVRAGEIARRRDQVRRGARSHNSGRVQLLTALVDMAWRAWQRQPGATRAEDDDRAEFGRWLREQPAFGRLLDEVWPALTPATVLAQLRSGERDLTSAAAGLFSAEELDAVRASWARLPADRVTAADAALLDELGELLGDEPVEELEEEYGDLAELEDRARGGEVTTYAERTRGQARSRAVDDAYRGFAHIVVDEAQDVSPMQWRMLARRGRGATWTVVGDWAQSAWPDVQEVRDALGAALGRARTRQASLSTNYRTSTEIADLAAGVLARIDPDAVAPAAVRSTGRRPALRQGPDLPELLRTAVGELLDEVSGTVGVVCAQDSVATTEAALTDLLGAHPTRLAVVDTWAVKGLEYDGCVVVEPADVVGEGISRVAGLRGLYVALTRATQALVVVAAGSLEDLAPPD